jgi:hypothetical protein
VKRSELGYVVIGVLLAAIVGGLIGDIIGSFLPEGTAKGLFEKHKEVGFNEISVQFYAISFTVGLLFKLNFVSVLLMVFVLAYFRWWYL